MRRHLLQGRAGSGCRCRSAGDRPVAEYGCDGSVSLNWRAKCAGERRWLAAQPGECVLCGVVSALVAAVSAEERPRRRRGGHGNGSGPWRSARSGSRTQGCTGISRVRPRLSGPDREDAVGQVSATAGQGQRFADPQSGANYLGEQCTFSSIHVILSATATACPFEFCGRNPKIIMRWCVTSRSTSVEVKRRGEHWTIICPFCRLLDRLLWRLSAVHPPSGDRLAR